LSIIDFRIKIIICIIFVHSDKGEGNAKTQRTHAGTQGVPKMWGHTTDLSGNKNGDLHSV